jgi:hypothetical protein
VKSIGVNTESRFVRSAQNYSLQQRKGTVRGAQMKIRFLMKLRDRLFAVRDSPELGSCGGENILLNSAIYSKFYRIKANSCNRNCQQHRFAIDLDFDISQALRDQYKDIHLSKQSWPKKMFRYESFNDRSTDVEIAQALHHVKSIRKEKLSRELFELIGSKPISN